MNSAANRFGSEQRIFVCGQRELDSYRSKGITHLASIANPGNSFLRLSWFRGSSLQLEFGDVYSEADARRCKTKAPAMEDIRKALAFLREAWRQGNSKILFCCDYGASRSPALAYVCLADQLGTGREDEAFRTILGVRPEAVPNGMVVRLGDVELGRQEALLKPLRELNAKINRELSR